MSESVTSFAAHLNASSAPGLGPDVLDAKALDKLRELDPKGHSRLIERVLGAYAQSLQKLLVQLPAVAAPADADLVRQMAHTLKSSSASVGALQMAERCAQTEKAAKNGDFAQWQSSVPLLRAEAQRVLDGLARDGHRPEKTEKSEKGAPA